MSETIKETVTFTSFTSKGGVGKNGKPYTIFTMVTEDGRKFRSFSTPYAKIGVPLEIEYTEEEKSFVNEEGREIRYIDRFIIDRKREEAVSEPAPALKTPQNAILEPTGGISELQLKKALKDFGEWQQKEIRTLLSAEFADLREALMIGEERLTDKDIEGIDKKLRGNEVKERPRGDSQSP